MNSDTEIIYTEPKESITKIVQNFSIILCHIDKERKIKFLKNYFVVIRAGQQGNLAQQRHLVVRAWITVAEYFPGSRGKKPAETAKS